MANYSGKLYGLARARQGKKFTCILQCWDIFPIFFLHFCNVGILTLLDIMYIILQYISMFLIQEIGPEACCWGGMLPRAASPSYLFIGTNNSAYFLEEYPALRLGGWTQETTRCGLYGLPSSQARRLNSAKLLDAASCEDWRQEKSYAMSHDVWILNSKS